MIAVKKAKVDEVQKIKQVLSETWIDTYGSFLSQETIQTVTTVWHNPQLLASEIQNPKVFFSVAKDQNNTILGLLTASKQEDGTVVINRLYVSPQHQGKGIGSKLLEESMLAFSGVRKFQLEVEEKNKKALLFYYRKGFLQVSRKEIKVEGESFKVIEMEKLLS